MGLHFALTIHLHDDRYHGAGEWPPSPARVFQALVAGAAVGASLPEYAARSLAWLERQPPPVIVCTPALDGQEVGLFVPNNDIDAVEGDPARVDKIRTKKWVSPKLLGSRAPLLYLWPVAQDESAPAVLVDVAEQLYQLGRGVDMAWASAEVCDDEAAARLLDVHGGRVHRPARGDGGAKFACPTTGSLESLVVRNREVRTRLRVEGTGKAARTLFAQPPKPRFTEVTYDATAPTFLYELRDALTDRPIAWPPWQPVALVQRLRDLAARRLRTALPGRASDVERVLVGRRPDGTNAGPTADRIRITPLPSIGHAHADQAIRRVVVTAPTSSALQPRDIEWAFSALESFDESTGVSEFVLVPSDERAMRDHFERAATVWRTVTPAALPASRRRIEPARGRAEAKGAAEREAEEREAIDAVRSALRHAGVIERPIQVRVQREPFDRKGARAERFAVLPRFPKARLWHVELVFRDPLSGPLVLGDGRFLGLGCMAPVKPSPSTGVVVFEINGGLTAPLEPMAAARALRRAVMARLADRGTRLTTFFTGHDENGAPVRAERSSHLAFHAYGTHLWIVAPHRLDRRKPDRHERDSWKRLLDVVDGFTALRAGSLGVLELGRADLDERVFGAASSWRSLTPYRVQRHERASDARAAVALDLAKECARRGLPTPEVKVVNTNALSGQGLHANVELRFASVIDGPLVLGRTRYLGGGLFARRSDARLEEKY